MKESTMYQAILAEGAAAGEARGRLVEARRILLRQGERRLGVASMADRAAIERIDDLARLEELCDLANDAGAATWAEFWALAEADGHG